MVNLRDWLEMASRWAFWVAEYDINLSHGGGEKHGTRKT